MINLIKKCDEGKREDTTVTLPWESRVKSRLRVTLDDGRDAGLFLERGHVLHDGDLLESEDGIIVKVIAADEIVSTVVCNEPLLLARACYHLGNRHVSLQISSTQLRYLHDPVLDNMLTRLGLTVSVDSAPFEPEPGAYESTGSHDHVHQH